jgi:hypothetical protein
VLTINSGGRLVWSEGSVLTVRGSIRIANPSTLTYTLDLAPGGGLHFDPSNAADRAAAAYTLRPAASNSNSIIRMNCSAAMPCTVRTLRPNGDEARARFVNNGTNSNFIEAEFVDFEDLGSASLEAMAFAIASSAPAHAIISFRWCRFRNVGIIGSGNISTSNGTVRFNHNYVESILSTEATNPGFRVGFQIDQTGGVREMVGNVMPDIAYGGTSATIQCRSMSIRNNFMRRYNCLFSSDSQLLGPVTNNFFGLEQSTNSAIAIMTVDFARNYIFWRAPNNPHVIAVYRGNSLVDSNVFETNNSGDGDCISKNQGDPEISVSIRNNLYLPANNTYPENGGSLVTLLCGSGGRCGTWSIEKNTVAGGGSSRRTYLALTELNPNADVIAMRSNLAGGLGGNLGGFPMVKQESVTTKVNFFQPGNITHNGRAGYTFSANRPGQSSHGTPYDIVTGGSDPVPGANDIVELPAFADPGRNSMKWAATKGYSESWNGVRQVFIDAWLNNRGDETVVSRLIDDAYNWVRQGYAPRNLRYASSGHDGGRIGAVAPVTMFGTLNGGN